LDGRIVGSVEAEGEWLASLERDSKLVFLATLAHYLTIAGRNSYTPQADGLDSPALLRKVNEIQHRVTACLRAAAKKEPSASFEQSIASWVLSHTDLGMKDLGEWAWSQAKNAIP
jgi:hypothetical protein